MRKCNPNSIGWFLGGSESLCFPTCVRGWGQDPRELNGIKVQGLPPIPLVLLDLYSKDPIMVHTLLSRGGRLEGLV